MLVANGADRIRVRLGYGAEERRMTRSSTGGAEELDDGRPTAGAKGHGRRRFSIGSRVPVGVWRLAAGSTGGRGAVRGEHVSAIHITVHRV
jgi:hypothetical protein